MQKIGYNKEINIFLRILSVEAQGIDLFYIQKKIVMSYTEILLIYMKTNYDTGIILGELVNLDNIKYIEERLRSKVEREESLNR